MHQSPCGKWLLYDLLSKQVHYSPPFKQSLGNAPKRSRILKLEQKIAETF